MSRDRAQAEWAAEDSERDDAEWDDVTTEGILLHCPYCHAALVLWEPNPDGTTQIPCAHCHATSVVSVDPLGMLRCWILAD